QEAFSRRFLCFTFEERKKVVAVEMHFESPAAHFVALSQLFDDLRLTGCGGKRWNEVLMRAHVVDDCSGLNDPGPANQTWHADSSFRVRILLASKRSASAVGPAQHFGAVVRRVDNDRVTRDTE